MWLFAGLGNPGDKYSLNRHNAGFMAVDAIADEYGFPPYRSKFDALISEGTIGGDRVIILKPQTYMNESGLAVSKCAKFFKIPPEKIVVFHDELDIPPMKIKVKRGGGAAGHNGLKSIDAHLGSKDYNRVRIGIGHPGDRNLVTNYVLGDFSKQEMNKLEGLFDTLGKHAILLIEGKESQFIENINNI